MIDDGGDGVHRTDVDYDDHEGCDQMIWRRFEYLH